MCQLCKPDELSPARKGPESEASSRARSMAVHVNRGVSCFSCHGAVNEMKVVYQHEPQSMAWCLECHRVPENHLRPPDQIFNMNWKAASSDEQRRLGMRFKEEWDVNPPVTCGGCHR
jgi:hypothetical protein